MKTIITILFFFLQVSCSLLAYSPMPLNESPVNADSSSNGIYTAKNVIYFDFATLILSGYANISYERMIFEELSIRVGYGFGYLLPAFSNSYLKHGPNLMINLFSSKQSSKFEIGLGVSYFWDLSRDYRGFFPAISLGYRFQPKYDGFIFRIGATFMIEAHDRPRAVVGGLHVSFGYAF